MTTQTSDPRPRPGSPDGARPGAVNVAAVDLGASSGRVMVGTFVDGRVTLTQTRRFSNGVTPLPTAGGERLYWDVLHLWSEIRESLLAAVRDVGPLAAVGIDTWGVDYGLVGTDGELTEQVHAYRSERTKGVPEEFFATVPAEELYAVNGLQVQDFNTVFQLLAHHRSGHLTSCGQPGGCPRRVLLLPDLLTSFLTGEQVAEVTNASTTGLLDARTRTWSASLLERLREEMGMDLSGMLPRLVEPGTVVGTVRPEVLDLFDQEGHPTPVVAVASHDTASAVVAVPASGEDFAYVSCGTWSLVGLELPEPVLSEESRAANFTNELGLDGTVRYLRNVMGLWVLNELMRTWRQQGLELGFEEIDEAAAAAAPLRTVVDINSELFYAPGDMATRIDEAARATGQPVPRDVGAYVRCVNESLALAYRRAVRQACELSGRQVSVLHMVGGGTSNRLLCQLAADATGLPVLAGPKEGTALGNMVVAARATGVLSGGLDELREVVRASSEVVRYEPDPSTAAAWDAAERQLFGQ